MRYPGSALRVRLGQVCSRVKNAQFRDITTHLDTRRMLYAENRERKPSRVPLRIRPSLHRWGVENPDRRRIWFERRFAATLRSSDSCAELRPRCSHNNSARWSTMALIERTCMRQVPPKVAIPAYGAWRKLLHFLFSRRWCMPGRTNPRRRLRALSVATDGITQTRSDRNPSGAACQFQSPAATCP